MHWLNEFGGQLQQLQCISEQPEQTRLSLPFFAANLAGACLYMLIHTHTCYQTKCPSTGLGASIIGEIAIPTSLVKPLPVQYTDNVKYNRIRRYG